MNALFRFFTEMDAKAARALWVSTLLFGGAGLILTAGILFLDVQDGAVAGFLRALRDAWWAPLAVTGTFTLLAFVGAPQIALIAATVAVFGPAEGIILSWIATMISAGVGFLLGRHGGAGMLDRLGAGFVQRIAGVVAANGFLAALIIRLIPSGPFIMVNMALGVSQMRASWFFGGTGVGIVPKIVLVAFAGHGLTELFTRENQSALLFLAAAGMVWLLIVLVVRPLARRARGSTPAE
jgi:uncharacterized membrane protein YdjX (TVP38/TMEM64 family)